MARGPQELARELAATRRARHLSQGSLFAAGPGATTPAKGSWEERWDALGAEALGCTKCPLCETRTHVVFGEGDPHADLLFVGEAPGRDEDAQGRPFVARAGKLLTDMIRAMGLGRQDVYIANVLKCRPPQNRDPAPDEVESCRPYLLRQIELIDPKVVCALGRHAVRSLVDVSGGITRIRGRPLVLLDGRTLVPTYHPAYLLRNTAARREAWEDLKTILGLLGRPVPPRRR
ncbi:MAG: uracil-DNA glycosylase family protein [Planctomycetota bacterium]